MVAYTPKPLNPLILNFKQSLGSELRLAASCSFAQIDRQTLS